MRQARRCISDQVIGETLRHFRGEEAGMGIGDGVELFAQCGNHVGMAMTEARDGGTARGIEIAAAFGVDDLDAAPADRDARRRAGLAMQDVSHGLAPRGRWTPKVASCDSVWR